MKIRPILVFFVLFFITFSGSTQTTINNPDKPAFGSWDFQPVKLWEVAGAQGDVFFDLSNLIADENETLYVRDRKRFKVFIINKQGTVVSSFGKKGEGPGEMKQLTRFFLVNQKLAFPDTNSNRVHYFSKQGEFLKSVVIPSNLSPRVMIDENRLISIPYINWRDPKGRAEGFIFNLKDKSKKELFRLTTFKEGMVRKTSGSSSHSYSFSDYALTPYMVVAYSQGRIFYGKNDSYEITIKDLNLKTLLVFSLTREKQKVPAGYKDEVLKVVKWPEEIKKQIKNGFPDTLTHFYTIFCDRGSNIYVAVTDTANPDQRKLDIFSAKGRYIYNAVIRTQENLEIRRSYLKGDKLYLALEDEEGELKLVKYKILLPTL